MIRSLIFLPMLLKLVSFLFLFFLASWVSSVLKAFAWIRWDSLGAEAIRDNCVFCTMYIPIHLLMHWFSVFMVCNVNVFRKRAAILQKREKSSWKFSHLFLWFDIVAHGGCCVRLWELCHLWTWRICAQETYQYHGPSGDRGHTNSWWYCTHCKFLLDRPHLHSALVFHFFLSQISHLILFPMDLIVPTSKAKIIQQVY